MERKDYEKALLTIRQSLEEFTVNPGAHYFASVLFFDTASAYYDLDSARWYGERAVKAFEEVNQEVLDDLARVEITYEQILNQRQHIATQVFEALPPEELSEWIAFVGTYPYADQMTRATFVRDSLAFQKTILSHSISAYRDYLNTYPESTFVDGVRVRLDRLLVDSFFEKRQVDSLDLWIQKAAGSPWRDLAYDHWLKLTWLNGEAPFIERFVANHSPGDLARYYDLWYYALEGNSNASLQRILKRHPRSDSIQRVHDSNQSFWFPVVEDNRVALFNVTGGRTKWYLDELFDDTCSGLERQWVFGSLNGQGVVYALNGEVLYENVAMANEVVSGVIDLRQDSGERLLTHVTAGPLVQTYDSVYVVADEFFAIWRGGKSAVYSHLGIPLSSFVYEGINSEGDFLLLKKEGLTYVTSTQVLMDAFPFGQPKLEAIDDYELVSSRELLIYRGDEEALIDLDLSFVVPWGEHEIYPDPNHGYLKTSDGYAFYGTQTFTPYLAVNQGFIVRKLNAAEWYVRSILENWEVVTTDSLKLINASCIWVTSPTNELIFQNQSTVKLRAGEVPSTLSDGSIQLRENERLRLIDSFGRVVLDGEFESVQTLSDTLYLVKRENRFGVFDGRGTEVLDTEYDFITYSDGILSLLKKGQLGALDLTTMRRIPHEYEGEIQAFGNNTYRTTSEGGVGLINAENDVLIPFQYDEIYPWTDTLVWAKSGDVYALLGMGTQKSYREVSMFDPFLTGSERFALFYGVRGYGIIGDKSGIIADAEFSDIRLLGTPEKGVIYAEQRLASAGFYVITFFNFSGERIHSMAIRDRDYDRLACDE